MGMGKHVWDVPPQNFAKIGLISNISGTASIVASIWSKCSFALTLLRIMPKGYRWLLWFIIITVNITMGLNATFLWARCSPPEKTWNIYIEGTCWAPHVYTTYGMFAAGYAAAADFLMALLPWKIIWGLQMTKKEKFGVAVAMSMGIL
jgi:hypothetical protein